MWAACAPGSRQESTLGQLRVQPWGRGGQALVLPGPCRGSSLQLAPESLCSGRLGSRCPFCVCSLSPDQGQVGPPRQPERFEVASGVSYPGEHWPGGPTHSVQCLAPREASRHLGVIQEVSPPLDVKVP